MSKLSCSLEDNFQQATLILIAKMVLMLFFHIGLKICLDVSKCE